jgi:hypothetical protein
VSGNPYASTDVIVAALAARRFVPSSIVDLEASSDEAEAAYQAFLDRKIVNTILRPRRPRPTRTGAGCLRSSKDPRAPAARTLPAHRVEATRRAAYMYQA